MIRASHLYLARLGRLRQLAKPGVLGWTDGQLLQTETRDCPRSTVRTRPLPHRCEQQAQRPHRDRPVSISRRSHDEPGEASTGSSCHNEVLSTVFYDEGFMRPLYYTPQRILCLRHSICNLELTPRPPTLYFYSALPHIMTHVPCTHALPPSADLQSILTCDGSTLRFSYDLPCVALHGHCSGVVFVHAYRSREWPAQ
jgi:hypothetical protein